MIANRLNTNVIGFAKDFASFDSNNILEHINAVDLRSFGLIPELLGRFPVITNLEPLNKEALVRILTEPKNAIIKQYQELFRMDGIKLSFSENSLEQIVEKTLNLGLGARGLRTIVEEILSNYMFESVDLTKEIVISTIN